MEIYPLTKPQQSIWVMEQYYGGSVANITGSAFFYEPVNELALQDALRKTLEQLDSLRICLKIQDGTPMQYIKEYEHETFEIVHFAAESEFVEWVETIAITPFDLKGTLYKVIVVKIEQRIGFVISLHHLTADAWTLSLFTNTVMRNLKSESARSSHYLDYLLSEREYENSARHEKDKAYFMSCFEQCNEPVYLSNKTAKNPKSSQLSFTINIGNTAKIQAFCSNNGFSPYAFFLNVFAVYLYRIKGMQDLYIGTTVLNRAGRKERETAGIFINTVPMLFHIDETKSILENIKKNTEGIAGVFRHQKYSYIDLLKDIREKYGSTDRLYDITLNYQNAALTSGGIAACWHFCGCQGESLNIHINDRHNEDVFHLDYTYQTELFAQNDIERLHGHLINLILDTIDNPNKKPQELKMLSDNEYRQVIYDFNDTAVEYPRDKCIHQLFEEQVEKTPDAVAVVFENVEYTYRQIDEMANSLAHTLRNKGINRNDIVAIIAKRSYKIIVAQLAILKAGGAYLPIDPNYPKERIDYMLDDAKCKIALVLGSTIDMIENIDLDDGRILNSGPIVVENVNSSDDLCYVIYTSGSTGMPKGAIVTHKNLMNFCNNDINNNMQNSVFAYCKSALAIGAIVFDISVIEIMLSLLFGIKVIYANEKQVNSSDALAKLIVHWKIDCIHITPTKLSLFAQDEHFKSAMSQVKVFMIGGEILSNELVEIVRQHSEGRIFNGYGPTETTIGVSFGDIKAADITIGKPIANTQIYILDKHLHPLPIGIAGELCISGDGVGRGYLNCPELAAEKFIPNPFVKNKRMYKTGDLAKWREEGNIEYIGRIDNQVKIRGMRIETEEIEAAVLKYEGIKQIAVVDKKDETGRQYICAYYINNGSIDEKALRSELAKTLPRYMIPHFFMRLETFPTTPSGKSDRNAFPTPDFNNMQSQAEYIAPVTDDEKTVVALMEKVLNIQRIGLNDDFFALGGDSLKAIEYVSKAQSEGFYFSLQDIFDYPTAALLIKHLTDGCRPTTRYNAEDFAAIHKLLGNNIINEGITLVKQSLGDVFITGSTGWLGVHILDEFLSNETGMAYCLVRGTNNSDSRDRLNNTLEHYFSGKYNNSNRIITICGDITENIILDKPIDTIIHCAANVKHYGQYQHFNDVNVSGTKNVIAFANEKGAKLLHISTSAVSGNSFEPTLGFSPAVFDETKLFIGQPLENVYVRSKFESEVAVLQAKLDGLKAVVIRAGNLSNRRTDYIFQQNYRENATLTRLKAFVDFGLFPREMEDFPLEFSPVDDTAKAVIRLAQYFNNEYSIFHVYNNKPVRFTEFIKTLQAAGLEMNSITTEGFTQAIHNTMNIPEKSHIHEAFIHDISADGKLNFQNNITLESVFTQWYLAKAEFDWPDIKGEYLQGYIQYFKNIKYWSIEQ